MVHQHRAWSKPDVAENVVLGWSRHGGLDFPAHPVEAEMEEIA